MSQIQTAKLFKNGRSQAVRLPKEFRFPGDRVRIRRMKKGGVLLEPVEFDVKKWFAELDALGGSDFMAEGRKQPKMPKPRKIFD